MGKAVYIAEKPSVARAFAEALQIRGRGSEGAIESDEAIVTWCVGHLVTMCYPDAYDASLKKWSLDTIPFLPETFKYEVIAAVKKQFAIVSRILNRDDVSVIYVCTDAGREGEYIYRLVEQMAHVTGKERRRVWIDAQTQEEILRGIREARDLSAYDHLSDAAYLRAKEDYLMGINFSRALTLKYGNTLKNYLKADKCVIAIGRVMTCVLGLVVDREREIRAFQKTPFYGVESGFFSWKVQELSRYAGSPLLYNEKGFKEKKTAQELIARLSPYPREATVVKAEKKKEKKNPPLLYNLAELQNDCARFFRISPDQTLQVAQELYEKKLTTYPRTDARVLSSAIAKEIKKNIEGLASYAPLSVYARAILQHASYRTIAKTRYVDDKKVTDHYAIIPTGEAVLQVAKLPPVSRAVYELIARRFLAVFYPPAQYDRLSLTVGVQDEQYTEYFYTTLRLLTVKGYLHVLQRPKADKQGEEEKKADGPGDEKEAGADGVEIDNEALMEEMKKLRKGAKVTLEELLVKERETSPPRRYNSGTLILTMENAGQFIEDEELRAQIKGSGIGTSATRAEILKKLVANRYLKLNQKTQIITPTQLGEMIYETVFLSMKPMLNPALTASWEKGLSGVAGGSVTGKEYMEKLEDFIRRRVDAVKTQDVRTQLLARFDAFSVYYEKDAAAQRKPAVRTNRRKPKEEGTKDPKSGRKKT